MYLALKLDMNLTILICLDGPVRRERVQTKDWSKRVVTDSSPLTDSNKSKSSLRKLESLMAAEYTLQNSDDN